MTRRLICSSFLLTCPSITPIFDSNDLLTNDKLYRAISKTGSILEYGKNNIVILEKRVRSFVSRRKSATEPQFENDPQRWPARA